MLDEQWWLVRLVHGAFQSLAHKQKMQDAALSNGVNYRRDLLAKIQFRPKAELAQKLLPCNQARPARNFERAFQSDRAFSYNTGF